MRRLGIVVFVLLMTGACAASSTTSARQARRLGRDPDSCLDVESDCIRSSQCCSLWCVNGECERREP